MLKLRLSIFENTQCSFPSQPVNRDMLQLFTNLVYYRIKVMEFSNKNYARSSVHQVSTVKPALKGTSI